MVAVVMVAWAAEAALVEVVDVAGLAVTGMEGLEGGLKVAWPMQPNHYRIPCLFCTLKPTYRSLWFESAISKNQNMYLKKPAPWTSSPRNCHCKYLIVVNSKRSWPNIGLNLKTGKEWYLQCISQKSCMLGILMALLTRSEKIQQRGKSGSSGNYKKT